jgi:hypothetical protein
MQKKVATKQKVCIFLQSNSRLTYVILILKSPSHYLRGLSSSEGFSCLMTTPAQYFR